MPALDEISGKELVDQVRALFAAGIEIQGIQIVLKNGQASPAPLGTITLPVASQSAPGVMSAADKVKLDGVASGATKVSVDDALSATSENPVQNKVVKGALDGKAAATHTHAASQVTGLTASRALVSDSNGHPSASAVTSAELGYLDGVTSSVQQQLNGKAGLASPTFTGAPKAPTAPAGTSTTQLATTAFVQAAVAQGMTGAAVYKGAAANEAAISGTAYKAGWYWVVSQAGAFFGEACEPGDMVFCNSDKGSTSSAADFDIVQANVSYVTVDEVRSWFD